MASLGLVIHMPMAQCKYRIILIDCLSFISSHSARDLRRGRRYVQQASLGQPAPGGTIVDHHWSQRMDHNRNTDGDRCHIGYTHTLQVRYAMYATMQRARIQHVRNMSCLSSRMPILFV